MRVRAVSFMERGVEFEITGDRRHSDILHQCPVWILEITGSQILHAMDSGNSYSCSIGHRLPPASGFGLASNLISDSCLCVLSGSVDRRETAAIHQFLVAHAHRDFSVCCNRCLPPVLAGYKIATIVLSTMRSTQDDSLQ
jgi:hypothetical protein